MSTKISHVQVFYTPTKHCPTKKPGGGIWFQSQGRAELIVFCLIGILYIKNTNIKSLHSSVMNAQGSITGFLFFLPFCHSRKIFSDHFVTTRVDFGVAFSINFLSSSAFLGFQKALEQDAISSSVSIEKFKTRVRLYFLHNNSLPNIFFVR